MYFLIDSPRGEWGQTWWLYGHDDRLVARAGQVFASATAARTAAAEFRDNAAVARYEVYFDGSGCWRWRAWRASTAVAVAGLPFERRSQAEQAGEHVRDGAIDARGP
jgi:hypothetical protein